MKDSTSKIMDLKLGFRVLSLNILILLVAYGAEARKMAEGSLQGKRLNFAVADEVVQKTNDFFWIYDNQDENGYHKTGKENVQVQLSSNDKDVERKGDTYFWISSQIARKRNGKSEKENQQVESSSNDMDLERKGDTYFWLYSQIARKRNGKSEKENRQVESSSNDMDFERKGDNHFWIYKNQGENNHQLAKTEDAHVHSSSHMDHIDPSLMVFFLMDDLKLRKSIKVDFPRRDLSPSPSFLPKEEADSIPFSLNELPTLLQRYSFSSKSPQAKAMEDTLRECEAPPIKGETKHCATSAEAMLDFVRGIMGDRTQFTALSTTHSTNSTPPLQKYTIVDVPEEAPAPKMVACHTMPYAYAIFYCHYTISKSRVFKASLVGENGHRVEAIAVCHLDTSGWSPKHVAFRVLGVLPGTSPVCHFFPSDHLVWVPKFTSAQDH